MAVCHTKKIEVIKCLLSKGANTEAKDAEDCTALFYECSRNPSNFEITKLLLSNGASANTKCVSSLVALLTL
jgi:ankyrin repeat protein